METGWGRAWSGTRARTVLVAVTVVTLAAAVLLALSQSATRDRRGQVLLDRAAARAEFAVASVEELGHRQATAGLAALAGEVDDADLADVASLLGVQFALLLDDTGDLLAVHPSRELDGQQLLAAFAHLRRAVEDGEVGVSATLEAPTMASGVAIAVAAPFDTPTGRRVLSTAFDRRDTSLDSFLATSAASGPGTAAWLVDAGGDVVATGDPTTEPPDLTAAPPGEVLLLPVGGLDTAAVRVDVPGTPWSLIEVAPASELYAPVRGWARWGPWLFLLAFAVGSVAILRMYVERVAAQQRLEAANDHLRDFVATAAHEIRTPTTVLLGFADLLARRWDETEPATRRDLFDRMEAAGRRLSRLVEDLMTQTAADLGEVDVEVAEVDVRDVVDAGIDASDADAGEVELEVAGGTRVLANDLYLRRVVANLVDNAFRHGAPPVRITTRAVGHTIEIRVRDHGAGIAPDRLEAAFQRRGAVDTAGDRIGLALSVARAITEAMGGTLRHEAAEPGSTFVIALPGVDGPDGVS